MSSFYVYEHWRLDRDECFYVGKGSGKRAYDTRIRNNHHKAIMAKLARIGSAMEVRIVASGLSEDDAFSLEIERIAFWEASGIDLANMNSGGLGGRNPTDEVRRKMSVAKKGKTSPLAGKKRPAWHHDKLRGKKRPEVGAKIAGRKMSEQFVENCRKRGLAEKDRFAQFSHLGPEASSRSVICTTDNIEFPSASAAARHYGVCKSAVIELCNGQRGRRTVGNRVFRYTENEQ